MSRSQLLDGGWQFCQAPIETNSTKGHHEQDGIAKDWVACSKVPTSVHVELFKQGKIPDPFKDLNEWDVQCELSLLSLNLVIGPREGDE